MTASALFMHPSGWFLLGALVLPLASRLRLDRALMLAVPLVALFTIQRLPASFGTVTWLGFTLTFGAVDRLSLVFLRVFGIMALLGCLYSLHRERVGERVASLLYVAGALGVVLAGDYLTLFVFWELMALASTFLVWCRGTERSRRAGMRYLLLHVCGGLLLLAGIFLRYADLHDLRIVPIASGDLSSADYLIMAGFALNAAVPPLHAWLVDAYPEATVSGAVFMSAFTTKSAVYALARVFPGSGVLMVAGAVMALYGVCYATVENDSRRILSYHIVSQVGYMVCGVGIGTPLAINGVCAHAFAHIIYKALLMMGAGSVLEMTGRSRLSELGGLYRAMPLTLLFTVVGGISISGFPLTSGFVSKSMIVAAAHGERLQAVTLTLLAASVGTFLSVGIKLPYFIWYGREPVDGTMAQDPPWNMRLAMGVAAFLCIFIGCYPAWLYAMLPHAAEYHPYTARHLSETLQLLAFTGLGFYLLRERLRPHPATNLDLDWLYRRGAPPLLSLGRRPLVAANDTVSELYRRIGLASALAAARLLVRFDREGIDRSLDGSARSLLAAGERVRLLVSGRLQQYIGGALLLMFLIAAVVLLGWR